MTRKTSTEQRPRPAAKKRPTRAARPSAKKPQLPPVRAVLPVRPHTDDTPPTQYPEFITDAQIKAAYAARLADLPLIPITAWTPLPNGNVRALFPTGASLTHTPNQAGFDALTPCPQGATHHHHITTGQELRHAAAATAHCTHPHGRPRTLTLAQSVATAADTQQLARDDIEAGLAARTADTETPKEHPQP
ncbi:hypothetical protein [Streptomyces sp. NPDC056192]|uniref:hypothetical protein n=1 Tax=Streptomyces sp. NPDC056192 TaxID=3345743 RepID=UPI0035D93DF4